MGIKITDQMKELQGSAGGASDGRAFPEPLHQTDQVGGDARGQNTSRLLGGGHDDGQVEGEPSDGDGISRQLKTKVLLGGRYDLEVGKVKCQCIRRKWKFCAKIKDLAGGKVTPDLIKTFAVGETDGEKEKKGGKISSVGGKVKCQGENKREGEGETIWEDIPPDGGNLVGTEGEKVHEGEGETICEENPVDPSTSSPRDAETSYEEISDNLKSVKSGRQASLFDCGFQTLTEEKAPNNIFGSKKGKRKKRKDVCTTTQLDLRHYFSTGDGMTRKVIRAGRKLTK